MEPIWKARCSFPPAPRRCAGSFMLATRFIVPVPFRPLQERSPMPPARPQTAGTINPGEMLIRREFEAGLKGVLMSKNQLHWPFLLLTVSAAWGQEVCSGPTAWICEEHQMLNAVSPPNQKFDTNSVPKELLELAPSPAEESRPPRTLNSESGSNGALQITPSPTDPAPSHLDKATLAKQPCLSQKEVHGGWPKYRSINGRHCWYASTPPTGTAPPMGRATSTEQGRSGRVTESECQDQAMKLGGDEQRAFLRQCRSSKK
jgi:hypothetical protein